MMALLQIRRSFIYKYERKVVLFVLLLFLCYRAYMWLQSIKSPTTNSYPKQLESKTIGMGDKTNGIKFKLPNENAQANAYLSYAVSKDSKLDLLNDRPQGESNPDSSALKYGTLKLPYKGEEILKDKEASISKDSILSNETVTTRNTVNQGSTVTKGLPNCIIFGTRKSGTAALMNILDIHPKVHLLNTEMPFNLSQSFYSRLEEFINTMPASYGEDVIIHKNADYFSSKNAGYKIYKYNPNIKLIVTVKHPVTRAIADYRQFKDAHPWVNKSFQEFVTKQPTGELNLTSMPLNASVYVEHLKKWYSYFPREQIHVVDGEKLITDPLEEIRLVEDFLGLQHEITKSHVKYDEKKGFYCMRKNIKEKFHCLSKRKGGIPKPYVDPKFEQTLREFYHPYNEKFFKLINRTFYWE